MNKIVSIMMAVVLLTVLGCATVTTGGKIVEEQVCSPDSAVMRVVDLAPPVLAFLLTLATPGSPLYSNLMLAQTTVALIKNGACVTVTELNNLIASLSLPAAEAQQAVVSAAAAKQGKVVPKTIDVEPLKAWAKTAKK